MLSTPDGSFDVEDRERVADWIELLCLVDPQREVSTTDVADYFHDSLLLQPEDFGDDECLTQQDIARQWTYEVFETIRQRIKNLGDGYPFTIENGVLTAVKPWEDAICFTTLLLADVGRFYTSVKVQFTPGSKFPRLFEKIVEACLAVVLQGKSIRFGWPRDKGWPKPVAHRIAHAARELGLTADRPVKKVFSADRDLGLDIITRWRLGDEGSGGGIFLTQCATGDNWAAKRGEPNLTEWVRLIDWRCHLIRAVAFPWRKDRGDREFARVAMRLEAVLFDRLRLLSRGNPDALLHPETSKELKKWCNARLRELPK
jgi:hypothetical protein